MAMCDSTVPVVGCPRAAAAANAAASAVVAGKTNVFSFMVDPFRWSVACESARAGSGSALCGQPFGAFYGLNSAPIQEMIGL
jgi:hypothetical protein